MLTGAAFIVVSQQTMHGAIVRVNVLLQPFGCVTVTVIEYGPSAFQLTLMQFPAAGVNVPPVTDHVTVAWVATPVTQYCAGDWQGRPGPGRLRASFTQFGHGIFTEPSCVLFWVLRAPPAPSSAPLG